MLAVSVTLLNVLFNFTHHLSRGVEETLKRQDIRRKYSVSKFRLPLQMTSSVPGIIILNFSWCQADMSLSLWSFHATERESCEGQNDVILLRDMEQMAARYIISNGNCRDKPTWSLPANHADPRRDICGSFTDESVMKWDQAISRDIEFSEQWRPTNMDTLWRQPPPGGTNLNDDVRHALLFSYFISCRVLRRFTSQGTLHVHLSLDKDYEAIVGQRSVEIQSYISWQLKRLFQMHDFKVENVTLKKGSVLIAFNVTAEPKTTLRRSFSKSFSNQSFKRFIRSRMTSSQYLRERRSPRKPKWPKMLDFKSALFKSANAQSNRQSSLRSQSATTKRTKATSLRHPESDDKLQIRFVKRSVAQTGLNEQNQCLTDCSNEETGPADEVSEQDADREVFKSASMSSNTRLAMRFTLNADYSTIAERKEGLERHLSRQLARVIRVPLSSIVDLSVAPGIEVTFTLMATNDDNNVMDDRTVTEAADDLIARLQNGRLHLTDLEGRSLEPIADVSTSSQDEQMDLTPAILGILVGVMVLMLILIIMAAILVRNTSRAEGTTVRKKAYRHIASQETGRDSSQSIGKYSYDSGLWMGPGPEPTFTVPDAAFYRPPTADEVASTPRPGTAVRTRLKRNWNIDPDRTLTPIPDEGERHPGIERSPRGLRRHPVSDSYT